jgi:hypothetical protein
MTGTIFIFEQLVNVNPPFNIKDFKITKFGVKNNNPFVVVQGIPGASKRDIGSDFELGYVFYTDKGIFGAYSGDPSKPFSSTKSTDKKVNGYTCLSTAQKAGKVVVNGHTLTITGIKINKINKVLTGSSIVDFDTGKGVFNCVNKVFDFKCIKAPCEIPYTGPRNTVAVINSNNNSNSNNSSTTENQVQCIKAPCEIPLTSSSNAEGSGNNDTQGSPSSISTLSSTTPSPKLTNTTTTTTNDNSNKTR